MKALAEQIAELDEVEIYGRVVGVRGLMVEVAGPIHAMSVGSRVIVGIARSLPVSTMTREPTDIAWIGPATSTIRPRTPTTRP